MYCMRCERAGDAARHISTIGCSGNAPQAPTHMAQQGNETLLNSCAGLCAARPCTRHALTAAAHAPGPLQRPVQGQYASHVQTRSARCVPLHGLIRSCRAPAPPAHAAAGLAEQQATRSPHSRLAERVSMVARSGGARHTVGAAGRVAGIRCLRTGRSRVSSGLLPTLVQCVDACRGRPSGVCASADAACALNCQPPESGAPSIERPQAVGAHTGRSQRS